MSTRSRLVTSAVAAGVVAFAAAGVMAQQVNPKLVITGKEAEDIGESNMINAATAEAISHACEKMAADHGQNAAIVITDIFGNVVHEHRMDGAARFTAISTAELKAKTARLTRRATSLRQYNVERNPNEVAREFGMGYFPTGGGLPVWAGKQIIGFIGVGGQAPRDGWSDEMCAWQALNQVVGQQPALPQAPPRQQRAGN
jgi:glc operon protein GlcG